MVTYGWGADAQLAVDLKQAQAKKRKLCNPPCPGYGTAAKCDLGCEYGIIKDAKKARNMKLHK